MRRSIFPLLIGSAAAWRNDAHANAKGPQVRTSPSAAMGGGELLPMLRPPLCAALPAISGRRFISPIASRPPTAGPRAGVGAGSGAEQPHEAPAAPLADQRSAELSPRAAAQGVVDTSIVDQNGPPAPPHPLPTRRAHG